MFKRAGEVVVLFVVLAALGCGASGPEVAPVSGQVTLDGKPVVKALVTFAPIAGGVNSTATTDESGNYQLSCADRAGALVGKHKVSVMSVPEGAAINPDIRSDDPEYQKQYNSQVFSNQPAANPTPTIPALYSTNSPLEYEVKSGGNTINLELKSS